MSSLDSHLFSKKGEVPETKKNRGAPTKPLPKHILTHGDDFKFYECTICHKSFDHKSSVRCHLKCKMGIKPFPCTKCEKRYSSNQNLFNHMKIHTKEPTRPFKCSICIKTFPTQKSLDEHITITHVTVQTLQCKLCGEVCQGKQGLEHHMRSRHVTGARFNCNLCGMGFTSKTRYESHLKTSHFEENKQQQSGFMCSDCGRVFSRRTHCSRHINVCNKQNPYQCAKCDKVFTRKNDFDNHLKIHEEKRPYVCSKCNNRFKVLGGLRKHMLTHTKERNFECDKCKKTFKTRRELTQHRAIHAKRNLMCDICGKTFPTPGYLKKHMKRHQKEVSVPPPTKLGTSIFSCGQCGDKLQTKQALQKHQNIHKGGRKFKCQLCAASFDGKPQYTVHVNRHEERLKQKESGVGKASPTNTGPNGNMDLDLHYQNGNVNAQEIDEVSKTQVPPEASVTTASVFDIKILPLNLDCLNFCMAQEIQMFSYAGSGVQFNKTNLMLALSEWFGGADGPPIVKVIANDFEQCVKKRK
ncbi:unnamed protein product [Orchesella dallaii]|uniref:C2H2-type domain-containing protein n=1 Tax=Orchesella dallaii TaxID=48710 RepID=A0ABP1S1S0_9HEXA